jgi:hypothetical protein
MKKLVISLTLLLTLVTYSYCQKAPVKFGVVSMDELQMTSTYIDTTAPAVVLFDYGVFREANLNFTRTVRIKILKKEGYTWANKSFQADFKSSLRGITTNLENGKIVQEKLHNDAIYSTRLINDYYILRPAMPNVKVGSVIDLEFSFHGFPLEWRFQEEIPVAHSELILEDRPGLAFRTNFFGYEKLTYSTPNRWIAKDMPAFKTEPYMSSIENFITKMKLDLATYSYTWEKVDELLFKSSYFGMPTESTFFLNNLAHKLSDTYKKKEDLLKAAYDTVRKEIVWNDIVQLTSSDGNLASVYKMKVGNSAEVNMVLYKLLKKLDFEVAPVALSTRDNGTISQYNPSVRQLNYFIVCVKIGDKQFLLDATEKYMPYYLLPSRCLNMQARLVETDKGRWLDITNNRKNKDVAIEELKFDKDLLIKGNITYIRNDYSAFDFRKKYSKFNSQDEYIEAYLKVMPGLTIKDVRIDNLDSIYKPVTENLVVEIKNQVNYNDNNLYIIPAYFEDLKENPFRSDIRKYPIDFGIPIEKTLVLNLTVPDGYTSGSLPQPITLRLEDNAASFLYQVESTNNVIRLTTKFSINKILFLPDEYDSLKEFYNQVLKKQSEPIILKKI